ncbi:MAG: 1-acyl-sn-glycerol-3-phosphate acyltransferase [Crocinitomicaceae bacterium]|nr:1-acyl-sn-glycerol-3-phosphate acyltransferase [Crocinitomicaceae bacterium]
MLYFILKFLTKLTLKSYFRRLRIVGTENIPENVPIIFIANHPSAFMDPIIVATTVKQPVYFIAAGEYVGKGIKGWIFRKWLHMIPVFRPSTRPEDVHKNKDMFNHCFTHLSSGGSLLIFPEGVSVTERKIKPFKTGVARIARGAEIKNDFKLNIHIVPVGLNYSNPHQFRSDVFVNIGQAIAVNDFISSDESKEFEEVEKLTHHAEQALLNTTIHVENDADDTVLMKLNMVYSRDLKQELGFEYEEQEREFQMQKDMLDAIEYFKKNDPQKFKDTVAEIDSYIQKLKVNGLHDKDIKELKFQRSFRRISSYILGSPFFLIGFVANFIPYHLVLFLLKRIRMHENFQGSMVLAAGLIIFVLHYIGVSVLVGLLTPVGLWAILLPIVMYVTGVYAQMYLAAIRYSSQRTYLRSVFKKNKALIEELLVERKNLVKTLEACREQFEKTKVN